MNLEEAIREMGGLMEPSDDEIKNGWTPETLTMYHAERNKTAFDKILSPPPVRPTKTKNALKWL